MFVSCPAPAGKTRSSPGCGARSPTQLAAVAQWLSAPPPSQVATAGARRVSRRSRRRVVGFMVGLRVVGHNEKEQADATRRPLPDEHAAQKCRVERQEADAAPVGDV